MEQVFAIMIYFGSIFFIAFGFCVANTAEGIYSKFGRNFLTSLTVLGLVSLIIGLIGMFVVS
jgi:cell division protein FtsX